MPSTHIRILTTAIAMLLGLVSSARAQTSPATESSSLPFVSPIFGDIIVLQRGKPNTIWGWSEPGDRVRVEIAGNAGAGVAGADGRWQVRIQPPPPTILAFYN